MPTIARIAARTGGFGGRVVTFGIDAAADVRATSWRFAGSRERRRGCRHLRVTFDLETPLLGLGNLANVLAATAVAVHFDVPLDAIAATAATLRPARRRGELLRLPGGVTLIDDSYNSSPAALRRALDTMASASGSARKIALLGEMLELGDHATTLHETCGVAAAPRRSRPARHRRRGAGAGNG